MKKKTYEACAKCSSANIQVHMWVNPNTMEADDYVSDAGCPETQWCHDCDEHCTIETREKKNEKEAS